MNSTSTAGELASEKVQRDSSAASLNLAEPRVQATEIHSQPVQHGAKEELVQTRDSAKQDLASDSLEATNAGGQADLEEDEHSPTNDIRDDVSIASGSLFRETLATPWNYGKQRPDWMVERDKRHGTKYARVAAICTEGLENRVGMLEKELLELQYKFDSGERPIKESDDPLTPESRCADAIPLKIMQIRLKDWKDYNFYLPNKWSKASIFLATTTETPSFQLETINSNAHGQGMNHQSSNQGISYNKNGHVDDVRRPGPSDPVRLTFNSPWPLMLIEFLSGEHITPTETWIYPYKHLVVYEKQIRKTVELLKEVNVDGVEPKDLSHHLKDILSEVVRILGPKRDDVEYSETYVSNILQRRGDFKNHHWKVKQSSPKIEDEELEDDTDAEPGLASVSPLDDPITKVSERSNQAPEANPIAEGIPYMCTCLKDARDHLQLLVNTMDLHLGSLLTLRKAIRDRALSKIRFEHLWHLFQPGDLVVTSRQPHQAYRVIHVSGGRPLVTTTDIIRKDDVAEVRPNFHRQSQISPFNIDCVRFDFDGEKFGPVQETISILEYEEDRLITKLDVHPMSYAEKEKELAKSLLDRGRRFAEYHDYKHRRYEGLSLSEPQEEIESEVIIDFTQAFRQSDYAKYKPQIGLQGATRADEREVYEDRCPANEGDQCLKLDHNNLVVDTEFDKMQMDRFLNVESRGMFLESRGVAQALTEDQLILLPYRVHGFSLRSRHWVPLNIDLLREIKQNDALDGQNSGFDDLVIPQEYKRIVKALVKSHALSSRPVNREGTDRQQIDLIRGKGKGLIILLHGVPGVGKTSTAESVAAYTGRPLFPITCGDIGQTAYEVEKNLEGIFLLARKWGCVLLLDEADVFLAKRERGGDSIDRNALISVFLRTLEYYSGILFLTTNRIGSFDEAFKSRIHISLYYAPLSKSQTLDVWAMNLNRLSKSNRDIYVDRSEIEAFARSHWNDGKRWNGRQIRNAFQTAVALAEYEFQEKCQRCEKTGDKPPFRPALEDRHFKAVARTSAEFDDYLQSVMHGQTHEQKALVSEMRNDTYDPERGTDTPSGKKHSYQRAVRPGRSGEQPPVREGDTFTKRAVTPPATPQLLSASSAGSSAPMTEEEEYRQYKAELEKKRQAEKMERFRKMHEMEQMG